ncbi:MAG: LysM domain-containing protein [Chthoniobacterales bacterium]
MKALVVYATSLVFAFGACIESPAQGFASGGDKAQEQLETLTKKIDEQNTKIDALSQQLLKLEQQLSSMRPGVMIGENTPAPAPIAAGAATASVPVAPPAGDAHVVAKGETLTSIAKTHKVGVAELQKFNHIENDRALQIGQTVMIPTAGAPTPAPSASPNE